jgi:MerR family transcriptional regulator, light-induced transcriptional regulator
MAARATGVSEATLRAWERRYGVIRPQRTESGYRLYDDAAIAAIVAMRDLVARGVAPSQAAAQLGATPAAGAGAADTGTADPGGADAGNADSPYDSEAFVAAARALDAPALTRCLDEEFSRASFERVADGWLMPALAALGAAWADGTVSVAAEHLAAQCVMRRLGMAYEGVGERPGGPSVVIGLPPGARHELGVLAFAVAARRAGLRTVYLGADVPEADWLTAADALRPSPSRAVVLAVAARRDARAGAGVMTRLHEHDPDLLLAGGGHAQDLLPEPCLRLGHDLGAAAATLSGLLAPGRRS